MGNNTWLKRYLAGAIGGKIINVDVSSDGFPVLVVRMGRGKDATNLRLEISQDSEGNGPGFIFGLPTPDAKAAG